jgi:hypothetical protein
MVSALSGHGQPVENVSSICPVTENSDCFCQCTSMHRFRLSTSYGYGESRRYQEADSMLHGLERRLTRLEKRVAQKVDPPKVCNCRVSTRHHDSVCLDGLLKKMPRTCPIHGFRELGMFWWTPHWRPLRREDNQFCPCTPHPWRSFVLNGPRTWEAHNAAKEAWSRFELVRELTFEEEHSRLTAVQEEYWSVRAEWYEKSGRQPPTRQEILRLGREMVPRFRGR